jgi:hypothetical protein
MKQIEIIYQPGFGGHLLTYLFSLDPSTVAHISDTDDVNERLKNYNFNNTKKFNHWMDYHKAYHYLTFEQGKKDKTLITCDHPERGRRGFVYDPSKIYYVVDLSYGDFANYWLVSTIKNWNNFPCLSPGELEKEMYIKQQYNPLVISLDSFLDPASWKNEYIRVSEQMQIPLQLDAAEVLYYSWYNIRVAPYKKTFDNLSKDQQEFFLTRRKRFETHGPDCEQFADFYRDIKDASWPDCYAEEDFDKLPEFIKTELVEVFNYKPKELK